MSDTKYFAAVIIFLLSGCASTDRRVMAFYYPWYGNAEIAGGSGVTSHWEKIDTKNHTIGSSLNYPALGPYDSHDPKTIAQHCQSAKHAGVDTFIASWWGHDSQEDKILGTLLDECFKVGMNVTIYYEAVPEPASASSAAKDILRLYAKYSKHPGWLRINNKPVIFVFRQAIQRIGLSGWEAAIAEIKRELNGNAVLIGDDQRAAAALIFDGLHSYLIVGNLNAKPLDKVKDIYREQYGMWSHVSKKLNLIGMLTINPGYNATPVRPKEGVVVDRFGGELYRFQWEEAIRVQPDWVLITSWNEWHEGTEIEPSIEHGEKYLDMTRTYSQSFRNVTPVK